MKWTIKEYKQWIKVGQPINLLVTKLDISKSNIKSLKGMSCLSGMRPSASGLFLIGEIIRGIILISLFLYFYIFNIYIFNFLSIK